MLPPVAEGGLSMEVLAELAPDQHVRQAPGSRVDGDAGTGR